MEQQQHKSRPTAIRADRDGGKMFVFHPEGDDLFVRSGRQVIEHCQLGIGLEVWLNELRDMAEHVAAWAQKRPAVQAVYAAPRGTQITLFVIPNADQFDFDLADEMVSLEIELRRFNVGLIETIQIPPGELDRFVDTNQARIIHDRSAAAHSTVAS